MCFLSNESTISREELSNKALQHFSSQREKTPPTPRIRHSSMSVEGETLPENLPGRAQGAERPGSERENLSSRTVLQETTQPPGCAKLGLTDHVLNAHQKQRRALPLLLPFHSLPAVFHDTSPRVWGPGLSKVVFYFFGPARD